MVTKKHLQNLYARLSRVSVKLASKPMELSLIRDIFTPQRTLGVLYVDGIKECYICEDMVRPKGEKIYGQTAIPEGRYEIKITMSNRFKRELPILLNVPNFEGIRIHSGNHEGHTEGCLLPGKTRNASGVFSSVIATNNLILKIRTALQSGRKVFITIKNEPNA
jgi:hypothetical protein